MEIILVLLGIIVFIGVSFLIIEHPFYLVPAVFVMIIYRINIPTPLPLDLRGILLIILFVRICIFDKNNLILLTTRLSRDKFFILLLIFLTTSLIVTSLYIGKVTTSSFKDFFLSIVGILLGFIVVLDSRGRNAFALAILVSGTLAIMDLIYTYFNFSSLYTHRLIDLVFSEGKVHYNHGFFGFLSGFGFIYATLSIIRKDFSKIFSISLMLFFSLGVLLSTSRSVILALLVTFFALLLFEKESQFNFKKIMAFGTITISSIVSLYFIYTFVLSALNIDSMFVDRIKYRLIEEPAYELGIISSISADQSLRNKTIQFRKDKTSDDIQAYINMDVEKQIFGLGANSYLNIATAAFKSSGRKKVLNAHNDYVVLLIERGLWGLFLFTVFAIGLSIKLIKMAKYRNVFFPSLYAFIFICIYALGNNSALTIPFTFLIMGAMIATSKEDLIYEECDDNEI